MCLPCPVITLPENRMMTFRTGGNFHHDPRFSCEMLKDTKRVHVNTFRKSLGAAELRPAGRIARAETFTTCRVVW